MYRCNIFRRSYIMYRWPDMEPDEYMDENDYMYDDMEDDYQYPIDMPYYYEPAFCKMYPVFMGGVNPYMRYMYPANYMPQMPPPIYPYYEGYSMPYYRQDLNEEEDLREESIKEDKLEKEDEADDLEYLEENVLPYDENCDVKMRTVDMSDIRD
ncbi:hypothetical protein CKR_1072 [Clostridium kluyveri NBRC 12016]|nr:hypothetical protein CKR_1072 [Clostridium kluyveri NBRC 12016]